MKNKKFDIHILKPFSKSDCFICNKSVPEYDVVYEDDEFIAILDKYPPTKAYTIVATKKHYEDITEVPQEEYERLQKLVYAISQSIRKEFNPSRICLMNSGGFLSHFHFHIIPMYVPVHGNFIQVIEKKHIVELSPKERAIISKKIRKNI